MRNKTSIINLVLMRKYFIYMDYNGPHGLYCSVYTYNLVKSNDLVYEYIKYLKFIL